MAPDESRRGERRDATRRKRPKLRSRIAIDGLDRTPHRAFLRATGLGDDFVAVQQSIAKLRDNLMRSLES